MFNPFKNTYAVDYTVADAQRMYAEYKATLTNYIEIKREYKPSGNVAYWINDFGKNYDNTKIVWKFATRESGGYIYPYLPSVGKVNTPGKGYTITSEGKLYNNQPQVDFSFTNNDSYTLTSNTDSGVTSVVSIKGVNIDGLPSDIVPPPPSIYDEPNFGYEFVYPKDGEVINLLNNNNSSYLKVPFKVHIKNFYPWSTKTVEEKTNQNFTINGYKTEINSYLWDKKTDILGLSKYGFFTIDGFYYIPVGTTKDTLQANVYMPTEPWIDGSISVSYTYDGSKPSYNPIDNTGDTGGSIGDNGNVNIGGTDYGQMPSAPVDGDIGDWFQYIGSLLLWLVTYPFKLLGQIVSTLAGYITNMFNILTPVTAQLNSVLSFIPSDILNVCWGFLSFTVLYSVIKSVFKMIRG